MIFGKLTSHLLLRSKSKYISSLSSVWVWVQLCKPLTEVVVASPVRLHHPSPLSTPVLRPFLPTYQAYLETPFPPSFEQHNLFSTQSHRHTLINLIVRFTIASVHCSISDCRTRLEAIALIAFTRSIYPIVAFQESQQRALTPPTYNLVALIDHPRSAD